MLYFSLPNFISSSTQQPIVLTAFLPGPPIWEPMGSLRWSKSALLDHLWPQSYPTVSAASSLFPRAALPSNAYPAEGGDWSEKLESHTGEDTEPYPCVQRTMGSRKRHPHSPAQFSQVPMLPREFTPITGSFWRYPLWKKDLGTSCKTTCRACDSASPLTGIFPRGRKTGSCIDLENSVSHAATLKSWK